MLRSFIVILFVLLLTPAQQIWGQSVITLADAYEAALRNNPVLASSRALRDAAAAREPSASLPPDPQVQLGAMNLSLPDLGTDMPGAMLPSIQIMQMLPLAGKLRLEGRLARQGTGIATARVEEAEWEVRLRVARQYYDIYRADRQLAVMEETLRWLQEFEGVAAAMYSVGEGRQGDVLRAGVEIARMEADLARMRSLRAAAGARLNSVLGFPVDAPVPGVELPALPAEVPPADELRRWAEESRPMLAGGRLALARAGTGAELIRREIWPDLTVGVQYGQRPSVMGTERMGSLMIGFTLPVHAGQRQLRMREESAAMVEMAAAELAAMRAETGAEIGRLLAELDRTRTLIGLYRTEVLPQAAATVTSAFVSYRVGRVDFMTLLDAQMTVNRFRAEMFDLLADYGVGVTELEMTVGRVLPLTTPLPETVDDHAT